MAASTTRGRQSTSNKKPPGGGLEDALYQLAATLLNIVS